MESAMLKQYRKSYGLELCIFSYRHTLKHQYDLRSCSFYSVFPFAAATATVDHIAFSLFCARAYATPSRVHVVLTTHSFICNIEYINTNMLKSNFPNGMHMFSKYEMGLWLEHILSRNAALILFAWLSVMPKRFCAKCTGFSLFCRFHADYTFHFGVNE